MAKGKRHIKSMHHELTNLQATRNAIYFCNPFPIGPNPEKKFTPSEGFYLCTDEDGEDAEVLVTSQEGIKIDATFKLKDGRFRKETYYAENPYSVYLRPFATLWEIKEYAYSYYYAGAEDVEFKSGDDHLRRFALMTYTSHKSTQDGQLTSISALYEEIAKGDKG